MKLRVRGEILRALTQRSYKLWAMTPRSYELLCLLSDWSTDDCHSWAIHRYTVTVHLESVEDWESQCGYIVCLPIDWLMDTTALGEVIGWVVARSKVSVIWNLCKTETVNVVTWFAERLIDWWKLRLSVRLLAERLTDPRSLYVWNPCKTETVNVVTWFAEQLINW